MDLLPALGLAAGASTFADFSPLISSFIRAPGRTVRQVMRNLTPAQAAALAWRDSLPTMPSRRGTPAYDYEIAQTGDLNFRMRGTGADPIWADGFETRP